MFKKLSKYLPHIVAMLFLAGFSVFAAWQEPGSVPPAGNVEAPINISGSSQTFDNSKTLRVKSDGSGVINLEGALGVGGIFRTFSDAIIDGKLGIGTTNPGAKLDIQGGDVKITAVPSGTTGGYQLNWDRIKICQFGTCVSPWKDLDLDGRTYMTGTDCDEGCSTCYVGSSAVTTAPDGRDQNCNGVVDEFTASGPSKTCFNSFTHVVSGGAQGNCSSYCQNLGFPSGTATANSSGCCEEEFIANINYSNCTAGWSGSLSNQIFEGGPFTCTCQAYQ